MALSIEDVVNQALRRIAYPTPVGYIMEGSRASRVAVEIYSQTRDELLAESDWQFARREVNLTIIKTAPVGGYNSNTPWNTSYPLLPWVFEYAYPANCIQVRSLRSAFSPVPNFDPVPNIFTVANDTALTLPAKVVLANVEGAVASITAQVTDPGQWLDNQFIEEMIDRLGLRFQEALNPQPDAVKLRASETQRSTAMSEDNRG